MSNTGETVEEDRVIRDIDWCAQEVTSKAFYDCTFSHGALVETRFEGCRFVDCVFEFCDLSLARFSGCSLSSVRFEHCKLVGIDWAEALATSGRLGCPVQFVRCVLDHSTFVGLELAKLVMQECQCKGVDLRQVNLSQADFAETDLAESLFGYTNLSGADLSRARNYRIDPRANDLDKSRFSLPEAFSLLDALGIVLVDDVAD